MLAFENFILPLDLLLCGDAGLKGAPQPHGRGSSSYAVSSTYLSVGPWLCSLSAVPSPDLPSPGCCFLLTTFRVWQEPLGAGLEPELSRLE